MCKVAPDRRGQRLREVVHNGVGIEYGAVYVLEQAAGAVDKIGLGLAEVEVGFRHCAEEEGRDRKQSALTAAVLVAVAAVVAAVAAVVLAASHEGQSRGSARRVHH